MGRWLTLCASRDAARPAGAGARRGQRSESAAEIAQAAARAVAYMPGKARKTNFDANDLAQRDGHDVLAGLLEAATEPPKPASPVTSCWG